MSIAVERERIAITINLKFITNKYPSLKIIYGSFTG